MTVSKYQPREKIKIISQFHLLDQLLPTDDKKKKEIIFKIYKDLQPSLFSSKSVSAKKLSSILDKNIHSLSKGSEAKELKPINSDAFYLASLKIGLSYFLRDITYDSSNLEKALNEIETPNKIDSYLSMILESLGIPKDKFPAVLFDKRTDITLKYNLLSALEKAFSDPNLKESTKTAILEYCQSLFQIPVDLDIAFENIKEDLSHH